jgi:hypothetical protein
MPNDPPAAPRPSHASPLPLDLPPWLNPVEWTKAGINGVKEGIKGVNDGLSGMINGVFNPNAKRSPESDAVREEKQLYSNALARKLAEAGVVHHVKPPGKLVDSGYGYRWSLVWWLKIDLEDREEYRKDPRYLQLRPCWMTTRGGDPCESDRELSLIDLDKVSSALFREIEDGQKKSEWPDLPPDGM